MKISARNVFNGVVTGIIAGAVNDEVTVDIGNGNLVTAIVTHASVRVLGIAVASKVAVIIKSSSVLVMVDGDGMRLSARNCLAGIVSEVVDGQVGATVAITLPGGAVVHATITRNAVKELGLAPGLPAKAVIKASSVMLGVVA